MNRIDLRSDTVTHPTPKMRQAMMEAPVGDDVWGDDPTVIELQARAAQKFGKDAALLVPSGTMANGVSILTHCGRGERVILGQRSHANSFEGGNPATLGGIQPWAVPVQPDGTLRLEDLEAGLSDHSDPHFPYTKLVALENTQAATGGQPLSTEYIQQVGSFWREHNLKLHIDGARIFNAATALETDVAILTERADSVSFCLSKGLCAPIGSMVVGSEEFIHQARRIRKTLGGGMRQAGIIAAAGIIALEEMSQRLAEDHINAKALAEGLAQIPGILLDPARVKTNMIYFDMEPGSKMDFVELAEKLCADNILICPLGRYSCRILTHYWIRPEHVELVLKRVRHYLS
ncbi:MAG TPA: low-specificity L-threonine aldolase [Aggregatilineales bacterium]|nr:low-specificity L-threonine aldolase [Aggregatilineales bacterium]